MKLSTKGSARCVLPALLTMWFVLPAVPQGGDRETGTASWYGVPYHGRYAASGEIYDMEDMTAAHPTLPFNTRVRVVNLDNDRSVEVRINDRGPFMDGRIIDVSRAAARSLGLMETGTTRVRLEVVGYAAEGIPALPPSSRMPTIPTAAVLFAVQTGSFRSRDNAERFSALMRTRYGLARIVKGPDTWKVVVGPDTAREGADVLTARIRRETGENNAFVLRLDSTDESDRSGQSPRPRGPLVADELRPPVN